MKNGNNRAVIDGYSLTGLLSNQVNATALLAVGTSIKTAGHDAWISIFIVALSGAYVIFASCWLGRMFPGKTLIEYLPLLVGNAAGKMIGLSYVLVFAWIAITVTAEFVVLLMGTGVFVLTPGVLIAAVMVITTTYAAASGIEVIGRTLVVSVLFLAIIYLLFILLAVPQMRFSGLLPVGEAGLAPILKDSFFASGFTGELLILAMLFPYVRSPREALVAGQVSNLITAFFIAITHIALITIMGVETASRSQFAPFNLADYLPVVGVKSVLVIMWVTGFWAKIALLQFATTDGLSQLLGIKERRPLILPVALIITVFPFVFYKNSVELFETIGIVSPGAGLFFGFLIPTILLIIGLVRTRSRKEAADTL